MKIKRLLCALTASVMLIPLTSCGLIKIEKIEVDTPVKHEHSGDVTAVDGNVYTPRNESEARLTSAKEAIVASGCGTYDGDTVFVRVAEDEMRQFPGEYATVADRMTAQRNALIEDELSLKLVVESATADEILEEAKRKKKAGDVTDDLIIIPSDKAALFEAEKVLSDISKIDGFVADEWTNPAYPLDAASLDGSVYALVGAASFSPDTFPAVFFNKAMLAEAGVDSDELYSSVIDGGFTWDKMLMYAAATDKTALVSAYSETTLGDIIYKSTGEDYLRKDGGKLVSGVTFDALKKYNEIFSSLQSGGMKISTDNAAALFISGECAFLIHKLGAIEKIGVSDVDFGILPVPAASESGRYISALTRRATVFAVPKDSGSPKAAYDVITAMNVTARSLICGGYIEYIFTEYLRDSKSADMAERIFLGGAYDAAYLLGGKYPEIAAATYDFARKNRTTDKKTYEKLYKSASTAMTKAVDKAVKAIQKKK